MMMAMVGGGQVEGEPGYPTRAFVVGPTNHASTRPTTTITPNSIYGYRFSVSVTPVHCYCILLRPTSSSIFVGIRTAAMLCRKAGTFDDDIYRAESADLNLGGTGQCGQCPSRLSLPLLQGDPT